MRAIKRTAAAVSTAATSAVVSMQAAASDGSGESTLDTASIVDHLSGTVTGNITTIGAAILTVGGVVYGIGVLRGFLKA
ncbi:hypothetical protein CK501_15945 [Halovibrio salipaludis]|uniref:Methyltransferase n=1 Tax=Halovibrio salipaludis TaxID=2032626 RepID=A0A2A2EVP5_9GAMM|nr:major capsid protein [Halovibrio salipaludis]PAU76427.1 hypothetical protein CK501_15945 [Halovibrio salipaludis]